VGMSVACLKYCATNRDARSESTFSTSLYCTFALLLMGRIR
jgi:hypothetical protein